MAAVLDLHPTPGHPAAAVAIVHEALDGIEVEALSPDQYAATIAELGVAEDGMKAMGRVMGVVTPQVKGRADGGAVAAEVRKQLG